MCSLAVLSTRTATSASSALASAGPNGRPDRATSLACSFMKLLRIERLFAIRWSASNAALAGIGVGLEVSGIGYPQGESFTPDTLRVK
jgi:hypothetical protein